MDTEPNEDDNFIESGGNSLKSILFLEKLESELMKFHPNIRLNKTLDYLLNNSFSELSNQIEDEINTNNGNDSDRIFKKLKSNHIDTEIISNISCTIKSTFTYISKLASNLNSSSAEVACDLNLSIRWKHDTLKCVDATPLIVIDSWTDFPLIFIGSHSKQFVCVNGINGELIWKFYAQDRIESSACLSKCGKFVIFGMSSESEFINL